ncbi:arylsulfatase [Tuwongella immobilis]|uniref:Sulfatase N-terminal domain-containing protein n=1 Tax=Tuwongella immobilis TaxID=692036 RepID=A0A6C2YTZ3_9BACT|nr:arylsulfatase [Tuwongella immobilis]VIP04956.1 arylsulfatase : Sulfatase OS=Pirellula staleyi (strain ATCC 27377 / DSM 6068 / ICPB 4128) GN=Psta_1821 PE=4 SV=1: Sulfatase [Tuwongella immobilis]VTS07270.1 arylsulfatase : Sulfatase OS=Pirellula staleyi (strain ATCC 27377 / DSM 6068 / ICPB 4128) GN=Psta_1821 PE=4 SV=1: Sulfatase [Tuwongella immobilis]
MIRSTRLRIAVASLVGIACLWSLTARLTVEAADEPKLDRRVLPIPEPIPKPILQLDARNAQAPPRFAVTAPKNAPNVVLVLLDDMGFGQVGTFGGPVPTPTLDRLAQGGLRYNHFHVAALCSPTRVALLTGRNHHSANAGAVMDVATAFPGYTGVRPNRIAPMAEVLRLNGYCTGAFGKYHETPPWEVSPSGPTDHWPTRSGFDKFYGFIGGETNQFAPLIYDGLAKVEAPHDPNYHFTTDMTNQAISWARFQKSLTPDKPFFLYYAPGATHAPHHVPKSWVDRYRGKFDGGWDKLREETLKRQIALGVVPPGTKLAPKPKDIRDWDTLSADEKKLFARQMEVFAAFTEHTDHEVGRLVKAIEDLDQLENTLFIYIAGDNGSSPEGGLVGVFNEMSFFNGVPETVADQLKRLSEWGGPTAYPHFAAGWAVACNAPFSYGKQVASKFGGNRNGMVMHWPKRIRAKGEVRTQFHHVIDICPTILESAGIPQPTSVNGTVQHPIEGVSMVYTFDDAQAPSRRTTQYFEIAGNRGIYHDGWFAGTVHRAPWEAKPRATLENDIWELYDLRNDYSQANDLAAKNPDKLKELQALFLKEAAKYQVLPIDDRSVERLDPALAGRPDLMAGRKQLTVYEGMVGIAENAFINLKNRAFRISAELELPNANASGVVIAQGGRFAGWSLYCDAGKATYTYNWLGRELYSVTTPTPLPKGNVTLTVDFVPDSVQRGAGGKATLSVNGKPVAEGRIAKTVSNLFSPDETVDVGVDDATPVTEAYRQGDNRFTGTIRKIRIEIK